MEQPCSEGHANVGYRMQVRGEESDGDTGRETQTENRSREFRRRPQQACVVPAQHKASSVAEQENNLSCYFLLKKIKPEDVTGGKAIVHEIIISLGH